MFKDYDEKGDYLEAMHFIGDKFKSLNKDENKQIYYHFTCATDQYNITKVFYDCQMVMVMHEYRRSGLVNWNFIVYVIDYKLFNGHNVYIT